jgi:hypothetical protein
VDHPLDQAWSIAWLGRLTPVSCASGSLYQRCFFELCDLLQKPARGLLILWIEASLECPGNHSSFKDHAPEALRYQRLRSPETTLTLTPLRLQFEAVTHQRHAATCCSNSWKTTIETGTTSLRGAGRRVGRSVRLTGSVFGYRRLETSATSRTAIQRCSTHVIGGLAARGISYLHMIEARATA